MSLRHEETAAGYSAAEFVLSCPPSLPFPMLFCEDKSWNLFLKRHHGTRSTSTNLSSCPIGNVSICTVCQRKKTLSCFCMNTECDLCKN